ncbi:rab effector Noc2 [Nothoprocta perdicaria]|uniref:rab effector Noc2 n=1 Tax=Nothoprocta perdicaria TaxID=30464 RepID=UPI000E1BB57F|nr:rab effector Noc2 [Nothoprocta perdicaria]
MADTIFGSGAGHWVCPNDRQLALRAKLHTGWSVHTFQTEKQRKMQALSAQEREAILEVIRRAERLDVIEQQRIGRLVERLENMRKNAMGNGLSQCLLCGELLGLLGSTAVFCQDCKKKVCTKCGIETVGSQKRPLWLCKICSEQREVWKRSGAWFYKGLPKYLVPARSSERPSGAAGPRGARDVPCASGQAVPITIPLPPAVSSAAGGSDSDSDSERSSCSLEEKPAGSGARHAAPAPGSPVTSPLCPAAPAAGRSPVLSGSHCSLASEAGSRPAAEGRDGDGGAPGESWVWIPSEPLSPSCAAGSTLPLPGSTPSSRHE